MNSKICFYTPPPFPGIKTYNDMIDTAVKYEVSGIEGFCNLDFENPDIEAAKRVREYADSKGIKFPCFSVYINVVGEDADEMVERLKGYADVAKILGSPYLHHTIANDFSNPDNVLPYKEELFKKGIESVRKVYDYAESIGIRTIYEEQGYLFNGVKGYERFIDTVDRNVGVVADFANIYQAGDEILDFVKKFGDRVVHAHIKDITLTDTNETGEGLKTLKDQYMNEAEIGKGIVDIKGTIDILKKAGYNGSYGIEYGAPEDDSPTIKNALDYIDSLL